VQELADEGIHVCIAAGNSSQKIDETGGIDYNNYYTNTSGSNVYYHRGGSPFGNDAMMIGNLDSNLHSGGLEQKASSSETGPGITVYAPGTNIMSAWTNQSGGSTYHANSNYKQNNITGTSMASPQVCGLGACLLQLEPYHTAESLKQKIRNMASQDNIYSSGLDDDYSNSRSILNSANKLLYTPFNSGYPIKTS
jgi:subtilisin family serine protease